LSKKYRNKKKDKSKKKMNIGTGKEQPIFATPRKKKEEGEKGKRMIEER
jgi:hypothetical protein